MLSSNQRHLRSFNSTCTRLGLRNVISLCATNIERQIFYRNLSSLYNSSDWRIHRNIFQVISTSGKPLINSLYMSQIKRNIFNDYEVGIPQLKMRAEQAKLLVPDVEGLRNSVDNSFLKSGINNIFIEELRNVTLFVETENHLANIYPIVVAFFKASDRGSVEEKVEILSQFMTICCTHQSIDLARNIWNLEETKNYRHKQTYIRYYTLLYRLESYEEIVRDFEMSHDITIIREHLGFLLVVAALCKIGNQGALSKLSELISSSQGSFPMKQTRSVCMYAWLAMKFENYGLAYDLINKCIPTALTDNVQLSILTDAGRLNDALLHLRMILNGRARYNNLSKKKINTFRINFETMKKLTDKVKNEGNENLTKDFVLLCQAFDSQAEVVDESLEEMVFTVTKVNFSRSATYKTSPKNKKNKINLHGIRDMA